MSTSEVDFSESSNLGSPQSQFESPYSSPSQQVPHLANAFSGITCDDVTMIIDGKKPYLRIVEQPQDHFRFRYISEMVGTHGCLLGRSTNANKTRTHPMVELVNYTGKALIRVRLAEADKDSEHPHKLLEDEQADRDVCAIVPEQGSYRVGFAGMGIIHTAKKNVPGLLFKKYMERSPNTPAKEIRALCENTAKTINLNIVRLKFTAHDIETDKEICPPVFSEPIHNMKSAATNDLKICRISRYFGRPRGGDDVFILVEKVNKKNIIIRFYELNEHGEEVWSANGNFLQSDVHHQYAIVFRTPPYRDPQITKDAKVYVELVRPSDGRSSDPKEFVYKADPVFKNKNKRRRVNSSHSSLGSSSGDSIKTLSEVPTTIEVFNQADAMVHIPAYHINVNIPQIPVAQPAVANELAEALLYNTGRESSPAVTPLSPMLAQPNLPEPPVISLNSAEMDRLLNPNLTSEEKRKFCEMDWSEYMKSFEDNVKDKTHNNSMEFLINSMRLVADSNKAKEIKKEPISPKRSAQNEDRKTNIVDKAKNNTEGYNAYYKADDGKEVKALVKDICEIIKKKTRYDKNEIRSKLERLFEMRLSNGDTFLHMALCSNQPSLEYIIKLIHSMKMVHLLNLTNDLQQSILHLAIIHDMPKIVPFLLSKGCDPMIADIEGSNAIHYAVMAQTCLEPLLDTIKSNNIACNLNACNNEKQTALHLAVVYRWAAGAAALLAAGAAHARDAAGRSPLQLAAYDDAHDVMRLLLHHAVQSEIDAVDGAGNTALQIVCSKQNVTPEKLEIVQLLLEKKADPLKHEECNVSAWKLAADKPELRALLAKYTPAMHVICDDDIKSEPEDDIESADESEPTETLRGLPLYVCEVAALLDAAGAWRALAARVGGDALCSWYQRTRSPTRTLLTHLKESGENISSRSLALHLDDMGQHEAAAIIRKYIE